MRRARRERPSASISADEPTLAGRLSPAFALLVALVLSTPAAADSVPSPDSHAPIGVMGDHTHPAGEWMLSYRYARMEMDGNRSGRERVSAAAVLADPRFGVVPTEMDMEMHVLGAMWAPSERVTLMAMLPLVRLDMRHRTGSGVRFTTRANGIGDAKAIALVGIFANETHRVHLNAGLGMPSGRISARDDTPAGRARLPYPMQLGSGSWELRPGATWNARRGDFSGGAQLGATLRLDENRKGYRWGHAWHTTTWLARRVTPWLSGSLRLDYQEWNDVRGADGALLRIVPTAFPELRAGRRLDLLLGMNAVVAHGALQGHRLAFELGRPILQDLDGPQLELDWRVVAGWQLAFE